ncbi:MAG: flagellar biosynthetic protein FliQ [Planctomycetota bacterium]|jgi:flagellar biosynthetic protein FliQ|nr:MAG: flagellar biosynthetic protein FliQ [Planctomycetota bacterium]
MTESQLVELVRQAVIGGCFVILPMLVAGLAVGVAMGLVQAASGVHEPIVGFAPKALAMAAALVVSLPWMVERLAELFREAATGP